MPLIGVWHAKNNSHTLRPLLGTGSEPYITAIISCLLFCHGVDNCLCCYVLFRPTATLPNRRWGARAQSMLLTALILTLFCHKLSHLKRLYIYYTKR